MVNVLFYSAKNYDEVSFNKAKGDHPLSIISTIFA